MLIEIQLRLRLKSYAYFCITEKNKYVCVCLCVCVECNEDGKFLRKVKDYKKGNVHNNNKKLGDKKEEGGRVGAEEDRDHRR